MKHQIQIRDKIINLADKIKITGTSQDGLGITLTLTKVQDKEYVKIMNRIVDESNDEDGYYIRYSSDFDKEDLSYEQTLEWLNYLGLPDSVMIPSPKPRLDKWSAKNIRAFVKLINLKNLTFEIEDVI